MRCWGGLVSQQHEGVSAFSPREIFHKILDSSASMPGTLWDQTPSSLDEHLVNQLFEEEADLLSQDNGFGGGL